MDIQQYRNLLSKIEQKDKAGTDVYPALAIGSGFMPSAGISDVLGYAPDPLKKGKTLPSFSENIASGKYLDAGLQTIGASGDVMLAASPMFPPLLLPAVAAKTISTGGKAFKKALDLGALPKKTETTKLGALPTAKQNVENITVYHSSPKKIEGEFKESSKDVGIHFAKNSDLAHNAGVKSSLDTAYSDAPIITEKFNLKVSADEIVEIDAKGGRFDFYDILEQLRTKNIISEDTFNKTFNELDNIEKKGIEPSEMMIQQNKIFNKNLSNEGIKVLKYLNEFDASPTFRELNNVKTEKEFNDLINNYKVKPDISYMVLDKNIIKNTETEKLGALPKQTNNFNILRKDASIQIDNPAGKDAITNETYVQKKIRQNNEYKQNNPNSGPIGLYEGITGRANNIKFNPEELINIKGEMGEEVFRMSGNAGKEMANKLQALKKSIKEDGYKPTNIKITVTEDGTAYITEGNHRLAEALQSKRPEIIADVNYLRGGETADGILNPKKLGIQPNIVTD